MGSEDAEERKAYAQFREKVRRTVFIDCLSPAATSAIVKTAIGQFGKVESICIIPNLVEKAEAEAVAQSALVVMEKETQARAVIEEISRLPLMIAGMPRPVRVLPAKEEMFGDRPKNPDRPRIAARWLEDPSDPEFKAAQRLRNVAIRHGRDRSALLQFQMEEEEKLEGSQRKALRHNYDKFELISSIVRDGSLRRLASHYGIDFADAED